MDFSATPRDAEEGTACNIPLPRPRNRRGRMSDVEGGRGDCGEMRCQSSPTKVLACTVLTTISIPSKLRAEPSATRVDIEVTDHNVSE